MNRKIRSLILCGALLLGAAVTSCSSSSKNIPTPQLDDPVAGEQIVDMKTSMGDITFRFFPDYAPKAVQNFIQHCQDGYYDGVIFHRVINGFMIQGGDPTGTGSGGESIFGSGFGLEVTPSLHNIRGALAMARTNDPNSNGSQFFVVQNNSLDRTTQTLFKDAKSDPNLTYTDVNSVSRPIAGNFPASILDSYINNGGVPSLDFEYTVFGQVVSGMDVVDAIAAVQVDSNSKPLTLPKSSRGV